VTARRSFIQDAQAVVPDYDFKERKSRRKFVNLTDKLCYFASDLGWMAFAQRSSGAIRQLWFGYPSRASLLQAIETQLPNALEATVSTRDPACAELVERLQDYATGQPIDFSDFTVDLEGLTPFQRAVVRHTRRLRYGQTASYGEIARRAGKSGAARAVGSVMARNRVPLLIPCHRVVAAGRALGGFSAIDGVRTKRRLLQLEGALNETGALIG
jgi:methylated-DNA-[protein]-cysteine S-methyltransferase